MNDFYSKLIDVVAQIVVGCSVGLITFLISSKLKALPIKKEAMQHTLEQVIVPIQKILDQQPNKVDEISELVNSIKIIMTENPLDIPDIHYTKIVDIQNLIEQYNDFEESDKRRDLISQKIRSEFKKYKTMIYTQCNSLKKQLGYPYDSFWDILRYRTGAPYLYSFLIFFFEFNIIVSYFTLYFKNSELAAFLVLVIPHLFVLIIVFIYEVIRKRGGFRVVFQNIKNKLKYVKIKRNTTKRLS